MTIPEEKSWDELRSASPNERARAAGRLIQNPDSIPIRDLMLALQTETVPSLRRLLNEILNLRRHHAPGHNANAADEQVAIGGVSDRETMGFNSTLSGIDLSSLIRHELSPAIGWIRLAADDEIQNFGSSGTNHAVRKLQRRLDGLVTLIKDSQGLNLRKVSIPQLLLDNWPDAGRPLKISPTIDRDSVEIETDEGLFAVLLSNVFENAIDASSDLAEGREVQINWGYTVDSYWIRISNAFKGSTFAFNDVLRLGNSTKDQHQGQGLALVRIAATRLGVGINLEGRGGIAIFSIGGPRFRD